MWIVAASQSTSSPSIQIFCVGVMGIPAPRQRARLARASPAAPSPRWQQYRRGVGVPSLPRNGRPYGTWQDRRVLPTFLVIGAMKSGTTSLDAYLGRHPRVFMAAKEPHYFVEERNWS